MTVVLSGHNANRCDGLNDRKADLSAVFGQHQGFPHAGLPVFEAEHVDTSTLNRSKSDLLLILVQLEAFRSCRTWAKVGFLLDSHANYFR